jgi:hypothetical protein
MSRNQIVAKNFASSRPPEQQFSLAGSVRFNGRFQPLGIARIYKYPITSPTVPAWTMSVLPKENVADDKTTQKPVIV